jgi:hypothetical protein
VCSRSGGSAALAENVPLILTSNADRFDRDVKDELLALAGSPADLCSYFVQAPALADASILVELLRATAQPFQLVAAGSGEQLSTALPASFPVSGLYFNTPRFPANLSGGVTLRVTLKTGAVTFSS